jgi:hypothetical protein
MIALVIICILVVLKHMQARPIPSYQHIPQLHLSLAILVLHSRLSLTVLVLHSHLSLAILVLHSHLSLIVLEPLSTTITHVCHLLISAPYLLIAAPSLR